MKKILVAAGGTGGHLFPAIAVVEKLRDLHKDKIGFEFFGRQDKIEGKILPSLDYKLHSTNWRGISSSKLSLDALKMPFQMLMAVQKSLRIIKHSQIDAVLCAGAYLSIPPGLAAKILGKKLFLMESNINLGKANKFLADRADLIFTSFEETRAFIPNISSEKIKFTGNPVRQTILFPQGKLESLRKLGLENMPTVLIFGGSLGAKSINEAVLKHINNFSKANYQIIWQCGDAHKLTIDLPKNIKLLNFIDNMADAYAAADLVISRSGATTVAELCVTGKPSVLVPLPIASNNEQMLNAQSLQKAGASVIINNSDISSKLLEVIDNLIFDTEKLNTMSKMAFSIAKPNASELISNEVSNLIFN